jgi:hypothetical protein
MSELAALIDALVDERLRNPELPGFLRKRKKLRHHVCLRTVRLCRPGPSDPFELRRLENLVYTAAFEEKE